MSYLLAVFENFKNTHETGAILVDESFNPDGWSDLFAEYIEDNIGSLLTSFPVDGIQCGGLCTFYGANNQAPSESWLDFAADKPEATYNFEEDYRTTPELVILVNGMVLSGHFCFDGYDWWVADTNFENIPIDPALVKYSSLHAKGRV